MAKDLAQARLWCDTWAKKAQIPEPTALRERWEGLVELPLYHRALDQYQRFDHEDPWNLKAMDASLLPAFGHDLAAGETLGQSTLYGLLPGNSIVYMDYASFIGLLTMRMMADRSDPLSRDDLLKLASLADRLFFGVEAFATVEKVPVVTKHDYIQMKKTKVPGNLLTLISTLIEVHRHLLEKKADLKDIANIEFRFFKFLVIASARRNGRKVATVEDLLNAVHTMVALFETDVMALPLVERLEPTA